MVAARPDVFVRPAVVDNVLHYFRHPELNLGGVQLDVGSDPRPGGCPSVGEVDAFRAIPQGTASGRPS